MSGLSWLSAPSGNSKKTPFGFFVQRFSEISLFSASLIGLFNEGSHCPFWIPGLPTEEYLSELLITIVTFDDN